MTMEKIVFGMHHLNVTQVPGGDYSHPNLALDVAGEDAGIDYFYNKMEKTCLYCSDSFGTRNTGNTRFFVTCDGYGKKKQVLCADGIARVVTIALTHSGKDYRVGKIYRPGEVIYQEGTAGRATGNHIHVEVAEGSQKTKKWDSQLGVYRMKNELRPEDVFWILDGYTTIVNGGGLAWKRTKSPRIEVSGRLYGVDVSNHNPDYDFEDNGPQFVIAKATEGHGWKDPLFRVFADDAKLLGIPFGAYHFARPKNNDPVHDAKYFVQVLMECGAKDALCVLDWETEPVSNTAWALTWLKTVEEETGTIPFIYMSLSAENDYDWSAVASRYPLWLAHWANEPGALRHWEYATVWQYKSDTIDHNWFFGGEINWKGYSMGIRLRAEKTGFYIRTAPVDGNVLELVKKGENAIVTRLGKHEKDGYQWCEVDYRGVMGWSQLDLQAYRLENG